MMENFKSITRLNKIDKKLLNQDILVVGWVKKIRKLGEKIFLDLMDGEFLLQVVFENKDLFDFTIKNQFLLSIKGNLVQRKAINSKIINGDLELKATKLEIISSSKELPFIIEKQTDALEKQRMKYRYLDLRRENINGIFKFRSKLNHIIRNFMFKNDFIEVETPAITLPTLGGSGQITTSSSVGEDYYYSLSQSPQIYKQLLMIGQLNRYYQIAKCFRDEKARSDRQMEFSQLDIEMSFVKAEDIKQLIESLIKDIFKQMLDVSNLTFNQMSYKEAIEKYGTDKPDLRFDYQIEDLSSLFSSYEHDFIKEPLLKSKLRSLRVPLLFTNSELKKIALEAKSQNAVVFWVVKNQAKITSSIKDLPKQVNELFKHKLETIFLSFDLKNIPSFLGWLRNKIANDNKELFNISSNHFNFLWVNNFPMFEIEDGIISSSHNPFTAPLDKDFFKLEKPNYLAPSKSYDLVLNGVEIAGGSERISNYNDQKKVFQLLGISEEEIEKYFGFFLEALKYGTPPHGGIAIGIDRLLSIMLNLDSIREVIAFPKTSHGRDEMTKGPFKNEK